LRVKKKSSKKDNPNTKWAVDLLKKIIKGDYTNDLDGPSIWLGSVNADMNVSGYHIWKVDKEKLLVNYKGRNNILNTDKTLHHYELIFPNGKIIVPFRQFCNHKILEPGQRQVSFFRMSTPLFTTLDMRTKLDPPTNTVNEVRAEASPKGTQISIPMNNLENENPIDIISESNSSFVLESVNDENKSIIDAIDQYPKGNPTKIDIKMIVDGINRMLSNGVNPKDIVLLLTGKALTAMYLEVKQLKNSKLSDPVILDKIFGVKTVRGGSACANRIYQVLELKPETYWQRFIRVLLFREPPEHTVDKEFNIAVLISNKQSVALATSEHVTMEAQRRSELQAVNLTGSHKIAGVEIEPNFVEIIHHI